MSTYYLGLMPISDELYHHGIKGQKWGIRRYQNPDGTLTPEGIARYGTVENFNAQRASSKIKNVASNVGSGINQIASRGINKAKEQYAKGEPEREERRKEAYRASMERGKKLYNKGYSHSKNILSTTGKIAVKSIGYGLATGTAYRLGMETVPKILLGASVVSAGVTLRDSIEKARDYERYRKIRT